MRIILESDSLLSNIQKQSFWIPELVHGKY